MTSYRGARFLVQLGVYAILGLWTLVCLFPLYWVVITTLKRPPEVVNGPVYIPFLDFRPSLESWQYILFNPADDTLRRYANSVLVSVTSTGLTIAVAVLAAYALARFRDVLSARTAGAAVLAVILVLSTTAMGLAWQYAILAALALFIVAVGAKRRTGRTIGNDQMTLAIFALRILPPVVTAVPIYVMAQSLGLVDSWSALIITYVASNLPLAVWLLRDVIESVPKDLEEAAQIDGASRLRIIATITLPLIRAGLIAVAMLIFVFCWNEYTYALFLTTDHALTMPPFLAGQMAVREQLAGSEPQWGYFTVLITLMVAPLVLFAGLLQRVIARAFVGASSAPS